MYQYHAARVTDLMNSKNAGRFLGVHNWALTEVLGERSAPKEKIDELLRGLYSIESEDILKLEKYIASLFEALLLAHIDQAPDILEALNVRTGEFGFVRLHPLAIVGVLRAANYVENLSVISCPYDAIFKEAHPAILAGLINDYAQYGVEKPSTWVIGQFSSEFAEYLKVSLKISRFYEGFNTFYCGDDACAADTLLAQVAMRFVIEIGYKYSLPMLANQLKMKAHY